MRDPRRRKALLQAALARFSSEGFEGATTRSIAADAGVTEAILFRHFPSKRDLFLAVVREFGPRELFREVGAGGQGEGAAIEALRDLVSEYLDTTWEHSAWLRVLFQEAGRDPEAADTLRGQYQRVGQALEDIFRDGLARGEFRQEIAPAAMQICVLAVRGFIARSATRPPDDWEAARDEFVSNLISVIGGAVRSTTTRLEEGAADGDTRHKRRK